MQAFSILGKGEVDTARGSSYPLYVEDTQHLTGLGELVVELNVCLEVFLTLLELVKFGTFSKGCQCCGMCR